MYLQPNDYSLLFILCRYYLNTKLEFNLNNFVINLHLVSIMRSMIFFITMGCSGSRF